MRRILCVLCLLVICCACRGRTADFEMRKKPMTPVSAAQLMREAKKDPPGPITPAEYPDARRVAIEAFVETAKDRDAEWSSLAKVLKEVTPLESKNQALPVRVLRAPFSGKPAWIVIQNWGKPGAKLVHAKVWAIGVKDGSMLYAASEI